MPAAAPRPAEIISWESEKTRAGLVGQINRHLIGLMQGAVQVAVQKRKSGTVRISRLPYELPSLGCLPKGT